MKKIAQVLKPFLSKTVTNPFPNSLFSYEITPEFPKWQQTNKIIFMKMLGWTPNPIYLKVLVKKIIWIGMNSLLQWCTKMEGGSTLTKEEYFNHWHYLEFLAHGDNKKLTLSFIVSSKYFSNNAPLYCLIMDGLSDGPHSRYTTGYLKKLTVKFFQKVSHFVTI